jgi:transposase-like protein
MGLGPLALRLPRDRQDRYRRELLPFSKRRTLGLEELAAKMFLGRLSVIGHAKLPTHGH